MNRSRVVLILGVAVALGLLVGGYVYRQLSRAAAMQRAHVVTKQVVVAASRLDLGTRLGAADLKYSAWPANAPVTGMFTDIKACLDRTLLIPVEENEMMLDSKLAPQGSGAGLPAVIPKGMRAVSVAVNDVIGVAGFVQPGTVVDVLVTGAVEGSAGRVTRTFLENIRVLAAGQKIEQDDQGKPLTVPVITLLVTPAQANELALASTQGRIQLALRNAVDRGTVEPASATEAALFGEAPGAANAPARKAASLPPVAPAAYTIEVIRGGKREVASFPKP
jgi:pilus assembly protein CpaB